MRMSSLAMILSFLQLIVSRAVQKINVETAKDIACSLAGVVVFILLAALNR